MFNVDQIASSVIGNSGGAYASRLFKLDTIEYSWVKDFKRDQELRAEMEDLKQKIIEAGKLPIHRDELRKRFENEVKRMNEFRLQQISANVSSAQQRTEILFTENSIGERKVLGAPYFPYLLNLTPSDIDAIFSELPEGVRQVEIDKNIQKFQKRIKELEAVIEKELSPKSRWLYRDNGEPIPYPQGCRWKAFADVWGKVQARFEGPVTINGDALKTDAEYLAHAALKLDKVPKLPPLRKPL
jgi:hypothetical protein